MSFDVWLERPACTHCGRSAGTVFEFNLTHNVNKIVDACLVAAGAPRAKEAGAYYEDWSWGRLSGWKADDAGPLLERALAEAQSSSREPEFRAMEPENGWGSLDNVRTWLLKLSIACRENPDAVIWASG